MSRPPSSQTTPQSFRVSDRDLTEIELHSVDSINDLHRTHLEHSHKGVRPPRPAYSPSSNGNPFPGDPSAVHQSGRPVFSSCQTGLQDLLTSSSSPVHFLSAAVLTLLLITVILTCYFLVQQGDAVRMLTEAVKQKEAAAAELTVLIQDLQTLRHNLTAMRGGT